MDVNATQTEAHHRANGIQTNWDVVKFEQAPKWCQVNPSIVTGYRPKLAWSQSLQSIFRLHNQTLNVWSHLIAAVVFSITEISEHFWFSTVADTVFIRAYRLAAIGCFMASASFHSFLCVSETVKHRFAIADYCGILVFMTSGGIAWVGLAVGITENQRKSFICAILACGIVTGYFVLSTGPDMRAFRGLCFLGFAASAILPVGVVYMLGFCTTCFGISLKACVWCAICGVILYASRFPQCFLQAPIIDLYFHSHFIFHCLVAAASFFFYDLLCEMVLESFSKYH